MKRLISPKDIPASLWDKEFSLLKLPPALITEWIRLLEVNGLREKAEQIATDGFEGGISKEDTDNHFAWRFTGSCARVMLAMLDPKEELSEVADTFARIFAGNKVFLADLPCGSGAATISILTTLAELRKQNCIPRMPLEIVILGGEISEFARAYASEYLDSLKSELENQAITINFEIIDWNVCDKISNTNFIKKIIIKSNGCLERLIILANFSGFLERDGKWKEAEKQFEEVFRYSSDSSSTAIWIEPNKNNVTKGFMPRLIKWFLNLLNTLLFQSDITEIQKYGVSYINVEHPLKKDISFKTNLVVKHFNLSK